MSHQWIAAVTGASSERRLQALTLPPLLARIDGHRRLRGPYTAAGSLVRLLAEDLRTHQDLARHDIEVLTVAPELKGLVPNERGNLTSTAPPEERTRYYPPSWTRRVAHGIVELLQEQCRTAESRSLVIDHADEMDPTDAEWLEIMLRRIDPERLQIIVITQGDLQHAALSRALSRETVRLEAVPDDSSRELSPPGLQDDRDRALQFIASECTIDDARFRRAYEALPAAERAAAHDARARELQERDEVTLRLGAIPFHLERGSDPFGAGAAALLVALEHCMLNGFYPAVIDLARRARPLLSWETRPEDCWLVTAKITMSLAVLGQPDEALALYDEACAQSTYPKVHLRAAYGRAMLYTRYYQGDRRNNVKAKGWINLALALSELVGDPAQRAFNVSFNENALALLEMHLGDPQRALELLSRNLKRLDSDLAVGEHMLHRSVLQYNRAQLLDRYGDPRDALQEYTTLIEADPHQSEYYLQRAAVHRRLGNVAGAMNDYSEAIRLSPPYPEPHSQRAELALAVGDTQTAAADLRYVLELEPTSADARIRLISLLMETEDVQEAVRLIDAGLELDADQAELHLLRAMVAQNLGDLSAAQQAFTTALDRDPTLAPAWSNRAILWFEQGEIQRAIDDLSRALELDDNPDIRANRAVAYEAAGRLKEAAADRELVAAATS